MKNSRAADRMSSRPFARPFAALMALALAVGLCFPTGLALGKANDGNTSLLAGALQVQAGRDVDSIVANMTLDEKVSQMIIPSIRTWNGDPVTKLDPDGNLAKALRKHQYGGVILYGQNIVGTEQTVRLVSDLQKNNAQVNATSKVPYFTPVDEEGGVVVRFASGTRMTGNMAVGATGSNAQANARATGEVLGEECAALGFNVDFAPSVDVNVNPSNPTIGTRSFSDDPALVGKLGIAFNEGLAKSNVIGTFKHWPGHGDTGTDSHVSLPSVNKTLEEAREVEFAPFKAAIDQGADMIMTAHITFPKIDEEKTFADGAKGHFPAPMSRHMIEEILRGEMGFQGVVVTDALEMQALYEAQFVEGGSVAPAGESADAAVKRRMGDVKYCANLAKEIVNAGADILLMPTDLTSQGKADGYDAYIQLLVQEASGNSAFLARVDESVTRILKLKEKYGILDLDTSGSGIERAVANAKQVVGSNEHHATEARIASEAMTLLKNDGLTLPVSGHGNDIVFVSRDQSDNMTIVFAIERLKKKGLIPDDAYIDNLAAGMTSGSASSSTRITVDYYRGKNSAGNFALHYTKKLKAAIAGAKVVVGMAKTDGLYAMQPSDIRHIALTRIIDDAHNAGAKFVFLSDNLPYDAACYQDSDAIIAAYMWAGLGLDPTSRLDGSENLVAFNANVIAAVGALFDDVAPTGSVPVNIPAMDEDADGQFTFADSILHRRGYGLRYAYKFTKGMNGTYNLKSPKDLTFVNNARCDKLTGVKVDGKTVAASNYAKSFGSTKLTLKRAYLATLGTGSHKLVATYNYGKGPFDVETAFSVGKPAFKFTKGMNGTYLHGASTGLAFSTDADCTRLSSVKVDGKPLSSSSYGKSKGPTKLTLNDSYLSTLAVGSHKLVAAYDYGGVKFDLQTTFFVNKPVLLAKAKSLGKKKATLSWTKTANASRYVVYKATCGKKMKRWKTVVGNTTKLSAKGLRANHATKFKVRAQKKYGKGYRTISESRVAHVVVNSAKNYTNPKKVKPAKSSVTIEKGKSTKLGATIVKVSKTGKLLPSGHGAALRFKSSDPNIAAVTADGTVVAKRAGACKVYIQAINGVWGTVRITVR